MPACPYCRKNFPNRDKCFTHMNDVHGDMLENEGLDAPRKLWLDNHETLNGTCVCGCGAKTEWNEGTGKPYRLSSNPECRARMKAIADANKIKVYGTANLLTDMERQKEMMRHRRIAGRYKFPDGGEVEYMGTLEQNFLQFCDKVMEFKSNQIIESPESFPYMDTKDNIERQYIPDYYLPDYNLLVEIKDGNGHSNGNPAFIEETKYKVALKDNAMKAQTKYNFIRISGKNYGPFLEILVNIVRADRDMGNKKRKNLVVITETVGEFMGDPTENITCNNERVNVDNVHIIIAHYPMSATIAFIGITDSASMINWYISDMQTNTLKYMHYESIPFGEYDYTIYKFANTSKEAEENMQNAFSDIIKLANSNSSRYFNVIDILTEHGINFDDGSNLRNNDVRGMQFIKIENRSAIEWS